MADSFFRHRLSDLLVLPLTGDRRPFPFLRTPFTEGPGQFSPDGRWVAYVSDESRRPDVYIAPFPEPAGKWLVSTGGGTLPRWRADGLEIFYLAPDNKLMAAEVRTRGAAVEVGAARALFDVRPRTGLRSRYAVSDDGKRFLVNSLSEQTDQPPMTVVVNWPGTIRK